MARQRVLESVLLAGTLGWLACSSELMVGMDGLGVSAGGTSSAGQGGVGTAVGSGGVSTSGAGGATACEVADCAGKVFDCGDCEDNDGDGLVDQLDPECLGACDNTEDSYYGGIHGQNQAPCKQDCYFDDDSGSGNDGCYGSQRCDPLSIAPGYPPSGQSSCEHDETANIPGSSDTCATLRQSQSATCEDSCGPLTPNGCDCFGCCELPAGSQRFVWLGSEVDGEGSCDSAGLDDPSRCKPCTPTPSCQNTCERCELCVGKGSVPADCQTGGGEQCDGLEPCGQAGQVCPDRSYCITGCCIPLPL